MRPALRWIAIPWLALCACSEDREVETTQTEVPEPETFDWCGYAIRFTPPPPDWRREPDLDGGRIGVRFTLAGSVGERIAFSEFKNLQRHAPDDDYAIEDVVDLVRRDRTPDDKFEFEPLEAAVVADADALRLDFKLRYDGREYVGRELYFLIDEHLFAARFQGLSRSLALFDRIVESVSFPGGATARTEVYELSVVDPGTDRFTVGEHRFRLAKPGGWNVERDADAIRLRRDVQKIEIQGAPRAEDWIADAPHVVRLIDRDSRQVVSRLRETTVDGRDALLVDTWDRNSHSYLRRYAMVDGDSSLLVVHMRLGPDQARDSTFESLVASLRFDDPAAPR